FINDTKYSLKVQLYVRKGPHPWEQAPSTEFQLAAGARESHDYGNNDNIYLNGIGFFVDQGDSVLSQQRFVAVRGKEFDNLLNMNDTIVFSSLDISDISAHN
nr:hypothetical protein [Deltaproteobacteria bacterium]